MSSSGLGQILGNLTIELSYCCTAYFGPHWSENHLKLKDLAYAWSSSSHSCWDEESWEFHWPRPSREIIDNLKSKLLGGLRAIGNPRSERNLNNGLLICLLDGVLTCKNLEGSPLDWAQIRSEFSFAPIVAKSYSSDSAGTSICATARKLGRA